MKNITKSLIMITAVAAIVIGATYSYFSDTETSTGNTFTAGDIDLKIDNESYVTNAAGQLVASPSTSWSSKDLVPGVDHFFDFDDLKPGDVGEDTISIHVGSNDAWMCAAARITADLDNSITEPEDEVGGPAGQDGTADGDLDSALNFSFWHDDGDNVLETNEQALIFLNGPLSDIGAAGQIRLADASGSILGGNLPIAGDSTFYIGKAWCFGTLTPAPLANDAGTGPSVRSTGFTCDGSGVGNSAQTDSVVGDLQFYATQSRNNPNFTCAQYTPTWPTPTAVEVGANLADYVAPTGCTDTVSGTESIQAAENIAAPNAKICVDSTYDRTGDNTRILIDTVGLTLAATVRGVDLDVPVTLSASNITVTGFDGVIGQAATPAEQAAFYAEGDADLFEISFNTVTGGAGAAVLTETGGALGGGLIANNVLSGASQGVYVNPHTGVFTIEYNDIDNNAAGIGGLMGAIVRNNEFEHTVAGSEAIGIDESYNSNAAVINLNNLLNNVKINTYDTALAGTVVGTIDAEDNFFSTSGLTQTNASGGGTIDFTPEAGAAYPHN